jgi:hypothetical protein
MPRFEKGNTAGTGRPKGSRNKSTQILDEIGRAGIEDVIRMVKSMADEKKNLRAAEILLKRAWPSSRGRLLTLDLPLVETAAGLVHAHAALIATVAAGEISTAEAGELSSLLENQRRALETCDLAKQIEEYKAETPADPDRAGA